MFLETGLAKAGVP